MFVLVGLTMLMVMVAAGVALAVVRQCEDIPCDGTDNDDVLYERIGNGERDRIRGLEDNDDMSAALYTRDQDRLNGGPEGDRIVVSDNDTRDVADGDRGRDICYIDRGDATRSCERIIRFEGGGEPRGFGEEFSPRANVTPGTEEPQQEE
jgi:hypothetical protein